MKCLSSVYMTRIGLRATVCLLVQNLIFGTFLHLEAIWMMIFRGMIQLGIFGAEVSNNAEIEI